ncbi:MAG TPA: DUF1592 domain-containing protein [Verrucomicrobiae bacterium]|nr:DUF1592 domain-containing protein [Verrucomicrobiae bacterium]
MLFRVCFPCACLLLLAASLWADPASAGAVASKARKDAGSYEHQVVPVLEKYCYGCHGRGKKKGGVALDLYSEGAAAAAADPKTWEKVLQNLRTHVMPPDNKPQPSIREAAQVTGWIEAQVFHCDCAHPDPGRVTLRRLNRTEYNNTIRDLVGVNFEPAEDFPADDTGYGFDNIGDVLSMPPILMEKYLAAAERILDQAILPEDPAQARVKRFDAENLEGTAPSEAVETGGRRLGREGDINVNYLFPETGVYAVRAKAYGEQFGPEPTKMTLSLNGRDLETFDVPVEFGHAEVYEVRLHVPVGTNRFAAAYINNYVNRNDPDPKKRGDRNLVIEYLEITGPLDLQLPPVPETHARIFFKEGAPTNRVEYARAIIARFASRAFRRPARLDEVDRLAGLAERALKQGETFQRSVELALQAVLISPHFLFRGELQPDPNNPHAVHPIDEYALASRLSYFLWSSMPDSELFDLVAAGKLRANLERQVRRMLQDPKAMALVQNFAGQWLQLRNLRVATPDAKTFPAYDEALRSAMQTETETFFEHVMRADRSVLDFLGANYTFVNERLARHYGIAGVAGDKFQKVSLRGTGRAGVLTQGAILTFTSNPTRTSPVKRGKYVLENILGTPPPPPPPNVPELKETKLTGTLRQRMEQHRENPTCASCHARMDPIGFGFEHFDGIGAWRQQDDTFPIDSAGQLVSGESFRSATDLVDILMKEKRAEFVRCLADKMLTYALGRGLEFYDKCALDGITAQMARKNYRFSSLVLAIVNSIPFQERRGEIDKSLVQDAAR